MSEDYWYLTSDIQPVGITVDPQHVYRSATEVAYDYLRERILSGDLGGGDRVNLDDTAGRLGLSRMPVRDAVRQLNAEGLLTVFPRRGVVVTSLSIDEVLELFETRSVLEGLAARAGMVYVTPEQMRQLSDVVDRLEGWHGEPADYVRLHAEFHDALCGLSRRPRLIAQIRAIRQALEPYVRMFLTVHGREMGDAVHRPIVEAIESGDPSRTEDAVRAHVVASVNGLVDFLKTNSVAEQR
jgi:DNA-binding GntR family transcriptional regulator